MKNDSDVTLKKLVINYLKTNAKRLFAVTIRGNIKAQNKNISNKQLEETVNKFWNDLNPSDRKEFFSRNIYSINDISGLDSDVLKRILYLTREPKIKTKKGLCKLYLKWFENIKWNNVSLLVTQTISDKKKISKDKWNPNIEIIQYSKQPLLFQTKFLKPIKSLYKKYHPEKNIPDLDSTDSTIFLLAQYKNKLIGFVRVDDNKIITMCFKSSLVTQKKIHIIIKKMMERFNSTFAKLSLNTLHPLTKAITPLYLSYGFKIKVQLENIIEMIY